MTNSTRVGDRSCCFTNMSWWWWIGFDNHSGVSVQEVALTSNLDRNSYLQTQIFVSVWVYVLNIPYKPYRAPDAVNSGRYHGHQLVIVLLMVGKLYINS